MTQLFEVLRWPPKNYSEPPEPTVYPGEVYELIDTSAGDPFDNPRPLPRYTILEVKQGWCRYRMNHTSGVFQDERSEISRFLLVRRRVET